MAKGFFKFIFGLIRLAFFLLLFIAIFHTWVIKQAITFSLSYQLGADVSIRNVKMDWKNTGFEVQGLEIGNPYSFPRGTLANIPLVIVSVDLPGFSKGVLRLKTVGIDLRELQVMNVSRKGLNLLALKPLQESKEERSSVFSRGRSNADQKIYARDSDRRAYFFRGGHQLFGCERPFLKAKSLPGRDPRRDLLQHSGTQDVVAIMAGEALKKMNFGYLEAQLQKFRSGSVLPEPAKRAVFRPRDGALS